jgi:transcriptional regulator of acetoin/glycerol metabolism
VRELRNVIERATILCEDGSIRLSDLALWPVAQPAADGTELDALERRTIERVMAETNGNKMQASRKLGISRMQLYTRLRKYGLEMPDARRVEATLAD